MARQQIASFFCRVEDRAILERVEFYAQDIRILRELNFRVDVATTPRELRRADLYFGWWWTWGFVPAVYARARRRPMVLTGVFDEWAFGARSLSERVLHRLSLAAPSANVFVSRFEYDRVPRSFHVTRPEYCPLTVDVERYRPAGARGEFLLCVAGSGMHRGNARRKCMDELMRAFALVAQRGFRGELVIVGRKGSDQRWLDDVVRELGIGDRVRFTGVISLDEKIDLLQRCALYLQPSRFEGFGQSILEAMACGAAVVSSPVGAVPELLGSAGTMADGTDPHDIAEKVLALLADRPHATRLGMEGRGRAETHFPHARRRDFMAGLIDSLMAP